MIQNRELSQLSPDLFISAAPKNNLVFDYPYHIRSNWQNVQPDEAAAHQNAAATFRNYLLSAGAQARLSGYHLQPARAANLGQVLTLDDQSVRALRFCWQ